MSLRSVRSAFERVWTELIVRIEGEAWKLTDKALDRGRLERAPHPVTWRQLEPYPTSREGLDGLRDSRNRPQWAVSRRRSLEHE